MHPIPEGIIPTNPLHPPMAPRPYQRWHPLRKEWVIYASHRQERTFLPPENYSPLAESKKTGLPTEMPEGDYEVAVFENLFPSMTLDHIEPPIFGTQTRPSKGLCEVLVFTKNPHTCLGDLSLDRIQLILSVISDRTQELSKISNLHYVLPFENRGIEMGVTLHHPHGQIYSYDFIPPVQEQMLGSMRDHYNCYRKSLLEKIIQDERVDGRRVIKETEHTIAFIPAFARYPYETWIVPKRKTGFISDLSQSELKDISQVLKIILKKFDRLWSRPFPYLMLFNQAPIKGDHPYAHWFIQMTPPYRSKDRLKYLAGTELGAGVFVNDSLPEEKAHELKTVSIEEDHE